MKRLHGMFFVSLVGAATLAGAAEPGFPSWPATAEQIRKGEIDVGKRYGMGLDARFHKIHAETLRLECATCHSAAIPSSVRPFSLPPAVDVSAAAPAAVDRRVCQGCHIAGPARDIYGAKRPR